MNFHPTKVIAWFSICLILLVYSCSKDSDLFEEVVQENIQEAIEEAEENSEELVRKTVSLSPINDAYIEDGEGFNDELIRLEPNLRTTYLMFDLNDIQGDLEDIELELTVTSDSGNGVVNVHSGSHTDWTEESITESNAPEIQEQVASLSGSYQLGDVEKLRLSSLSLETKKISLILIQTSGNDIALASKENVSDKGPKLNVTYLTKEGEEEVGEEEEEEEVEEEVAEDEDVNNIENKGELKAFPTAHGAGAYATGGRGHQVVKVTNLNDSGPGSLREALSNGNRTVVFNVSGIIKLQSRLIVTGDNITIAGQTAPSGGITITGGNINERVVWRGDNAIIRYVRFRPVFDPNSTTDGIDFEGGLENIIIDHCSFSWGGDEIISFVGSAGNQPDKITFQRNIVYKAWKGHIMGYSAWYDDGQSERPTGDFSYNQNLIAHTSHRVPANTVTDDRFDAINNVVHNWLLRLSSLRPFNNADVNFQGNYLSGGCKSVNPNSNNYSFNNLQYHPNLGVPTIYSNGNFYNKYPEAKESDFWHWWVVAEPGKKVGDAVGENFFTGSAFPQLGDAFPVKSATETFVDLTSGGAGAVKRLDERGFVVSDIDPLDGNAINDVINDVCIQYSYADPVPAWASSSEYQSFRSSITGEPINQHPSNFDSDNDGMPDVWERSVFGDLSRDGRGDFNGNGYSDVEEYLNLIDF